MCIKRYFIIFQGIGFGLVGTPSIAIVGLYFDKRRPMLTTLASVGPGLGCSVFPPFYAKMIKNYGWQGSMLILSGVCLQVVVLGALFRQLPSDTRREFRRQQRVTGHAFSERNRIKISLHAVNILMCYIGSYIVFVLSVDFGKSEEMPVETVVALYGLVGAMNVISRLLIAPLVGKSWFNRPLVYTVFCGLQAITGGLFFLGTNVLTFCVLCILFGIFYGVFYGLLTAVNTDIFGIENLLTVEGIVALFAGFGSITGPYVGGRRLYILFAFLPFSPMVLFYILHHVLLLLFFAVKIGVPVQTKVYVILLYL